MYSYVEIIWPEVPNKYHIEKLLGEGGFGVVYKALCTENNRYCALKRLPIINSNESNEREVKAMLMSSCANVVKMHKVFYYKNDMWLVLEMMRNSLRASIVARETKKIKYSENTIIYVLQNIVKAMYGMYQMGVVHRDIKPNNILISSKGDVKLADFGLATFFETGHLPDGQKKIAGTPPFMAPEIYLKKDYDARCDVWSMAITILKMMSFKNPVEYSDKKLFPVLHTVIRNRTMHITENYSKELRRILLGSVKVKVEYRYTIQKITQSKIQKRKINELFARLDLME